jgi:hypothetical protein
MSDTNDRITTLEQKVELAFTLDKRLKDLEDSVKQLRPRSALRDWLQAFGPYLSGVAVVIIGFMLKDSVTLAMQREQLDLAYVKDVRDLIEDFDAAKEQPAADANAVALAMYGRFAIVPLIERLQGGDVAHLAAERGLQLVGANDPAQACPRFTKLLDDPAHRYTWQTHKSLVRLIGKSECISSVAALERYAASVNQAAADPPQLATFAARFSNAGAFDAESADRLKQDAADALAILRVQRERAEQEEPAWWR